jgi:hypothetical protein
LRYVAFMLMLIAFAHAATLKVGASQTYRTINSALDAAAAGDTVQVDPGTYSEDIDLRNLDITLVSVSGYAMTTISPTSPIYLAGSTIEGFTISPAPAQAVAISGNATLKQLRILDPSSYGVVVTSGTALIQEVLVENAGLHAFISTGGLVTFRRCISYNAAQVGFAVQSTSAATVQNSIAIGGQYGFRAQSSTATFDHLVAVGASKAGILAVSTVNCSNSAFEDNAEVIECSGGTASFSNGVAWASATAKNCASSTLNNVDEADPIFARWTAGLPLIELDFRPGGGSPMTGAGSDGDLGAFDGGNGSWTNADGDGLPTLFDCDDKTAATYTGAYEIADGKDNDCDGLIDEDIPIDTGTDDTATDDSDPPDPSGSDLDGDGYKASVDCDDHNIATHPGAIELTDGADNDCDTKIDEGTAWGDDDNDGFSEINGDCDDTDPTRYPTAIDTQNDGLDNDCDGADDNATDKDRDADGVTDLDGDCDDTDPAVKPGVSDPLDGVDNDCDGQTDEDGLNVDADGDGVTILEGDCNDNNPVVYAGAIDIPDDFIDQDCTGTDNYDVDRDGDPSPISGGADCDDNNSTRSSLELEVCGDGVDQDCDDEDPACDSGKEVVAGPDCGCVSGGGGSLVGLLGVVGLCRRAKRVGRREAESTKKG